MPWSNNNGGDGPWGNPGGGSGGGNRGGNQGGPRGPWGQGPRGGGGGGQQPPNIEDLFRKGQDSFRKFGGGSGGLGPKGIFLLVLVLIAGWLFTGVYRVNPEEQGVVLRFGEYSRTTPPGLHFHFPYPIESVQKPAVTRVNQTEIGFRDTVERNVPEESLMLTGDENIVEIDLVVLWVIKDARNFLFNVYRPDLVVKGVAESAVRETIGQRKLAPILTQGRGEIQTAVRTLMQKALDDYGTGIEIREVELQKVDPPAQVIDAFRDVQAARQDQERAENEAKAYANKVVPEARGEAAKILQEAQAYKEQTVAGAEGEAARFNSIYDEYKNAKDVTKRRMYLETMEKVLRNTNKVVVDGQAGSGVVPYLPLPELRKSATSGSNAAGN